MNHDCCGDYIEDAQLYRCLADSRFHEGPLPDVCPLCGREISATVHKTAIQKRVVSRVIMIDGMDFVVASSVSKIWHGQEVWK